MTGLRVLTGLPQIDPLLSLAACVFTGLIFTRALSHKLAEFGIFQAEFADYRLLLPALVPVFAAILIVGEIAAVLGLCVPAARPFAATGAAALLLLYAAVMSSALLSGRDRIECGCGGEGQLISAGLVIRNAVLALIAFVAALPVTGRVLTGFDFATLLAISAIGWLLLNAAERLIETGSHVRRVRANTRAMQDGAA